MKTKINILFITFFFLLHIVTAQTLFEHTQDWIVQPTNISISNFTTFVDSVNAHEAMPKINAISFSPNSVGFSTTDFWPQGTWLHGYFERGEFWSNKCAVDTCVTCTHNNIGWPSSHPLHRINSKMIRALIHANHACPGASWVADNIQNIKEGIDYMISSQQSGTGDLVEEGGFTWWFTRPGQLTPNSNEDRNANYTHAYETSHALRTMCEAYMYFQDNGIYYSNITGLYQAIVKAADNLERKKLDPGLPPTPIGDNNDESSACDLSNSNYKGFALWALAGAYKVTGDNKYLSKAKAIADKLILYQTTDGGIQDGMWLTGGCDSDGCGKFSNPNDGTDPCGEGVDQFTTDNNRIFHDTRIFYHCIILRGLVEMMDITPDAEIAWKISLIANIKKAVNHLMKYRVAYFDDSNLDISPGMVRTSWTAIDGGTTCGP